MPRVFTLDGLGFKNQKQKQADYQMHFPVNLEGGKIS